jgi:hypothetical protein
MAIISLPGSFRPVGFSFGQQRFDTMERSDSTGAEAARLLAPPRWTCGVQSADHMTLVEAGQWEAWCLKLRGGVNVAAIYDPVRQTPQGGVTGSLKLVGDLPAGSTSMTLTGNTNALGFDAGDWMQIGSGVGTSHLCKAVADVDPSGSGGAFTWTSFTWTSFTWVDANTITVAFEPPTRVAFAQGSAVTIDRPVGYYRMRGSPKWQYSQRAYRREGGFAVDFIETFSA